MNDSRKKTTQPNKGVRRRLRVYLFVLVAFMGWAAFTLIGQNSKVDSTQSQLDSLLEKQQVIAQQSNQLKLQMVRLNDPEYIGQIARRDLGMSMPGETSIHITKPQP